MRQNVATALEALGVVAASAAGLTVSLGLGLAVAGLGLVLFGLALERD